MTELSTWQPWTQDGERRVLGELTPPAGGVVIVECDLFEPTKGAVVDSQWLDVWRNDSTGHVSNMPPRERALARQNGWHEYGIGDVIREIDTRPDTLFILRTAYPERVREMWTPWMYHACETGDCPHTRQSECDAEGSRFHRPNVALYATAETQEQLDTRADALAKCRDLCGFLGLWLNPRKALDLRGVLKQPWMPDRIVKPGSVPVEYIDVKGMDSIIIRGEQHPIHPDWVRGLRDQCQAASVPLRFESWGEWVPDEDCQVPFSNCVWSIWMHPDGRCTDAFNQPSAEWRLILEVGREHSGRTLDGREWLELPSLRSEGE